MTCGLLVSQLVFAFQAAVRKGRPLLQSDGRAVHGGVLRYLLENVPEGRLEVAIPGQQIFEELRFALA